MLSNEDIRIIKELIDTIEDIDTHIWCDEPYAAQTEAHVFYSDELKDLIEKAPDVLKKIVENIE